MSKKESVENTNESIVAQTPSFQLGTYHKKALVVLLHCYYGNRQTLTYSELSQRLDVGEKTKAWQCEAWRDLKGNAYIVSSSADKKKYELSFPNGVQMASTDGSRIKTPVTLDGETMVPPAILSRLN